jgi:hypothetical protein
MREKASSISGENMKKLQVLLLGIVMLSSGIAHSECTNFSQGTAIAFGKICLSNDSPQAGDFVTIEIYKTDNNYLNPQLFTQGNYLRGPTLSTPPSQMPGAACVFENNCGYLKTGYDFTRETPTAFYNTISFEVRANQSPTTFDIFLFDGDEVWAQ